MAVFNLILVFRTRYLVKDVLATLKPQGYLPGGQQYSNKMKEHYDLYLSPKGEQILQEKQRKTNFSYTLFENITSIFPLMGILGTVISLIPMVNEISSSVNQTNLFFAALTSTFWGIIFAIVFKAVNGLLQAELDFCNKLTDLYFERNSLLFDLENKNNKISSNSYLNTRHDLSKFKLDYPFFDKKNDQDKENQAEVNDEEKAREEVLVNDSMNQSLSTNNEIVEEEYSEIEEELE